MTMWGPSAWLAHLRMKLVWWRNDIHWFKRRNIKLWWKESVKILEGKYKNLEMTNVMNIFLSFNITNMKENIHRPKKTRPSLSWNLNPVVSYDSFTGLSLSKCGLMWLHQFHIRISEYKGPQQTSWEKKGICRICIFHDISLGVVIFLSHVYWKTWYKDYFCILLTCLDYLLKKYSSISIRIYFVINKDDLP